jgi:hypothetical protein
MSAGRGFDRRKLAQQLLDATEGHVVLKDIIDRKLNSYEETLIDMGDIEEDGADDELEPEEMERVPPAPALASPPVLAQWAPDPLGRHELRYFDGKQWTAHVSDAGVQGHNPV